MYEVAIEPELTCASHALRGWVTCRLKNRIECGQCCEPVALPLNYMKFLIEGDSASDMTSSSLTVTCLNNTMNSCPFCLPCGLPLFLVFLDCL